jgi:hypothetical protein
MRALAVNMKRRLRATVGLSELMVFLLFSSYGPTVHFLGHLRITEIMLIFLWLVYLQKGIIYVGFRSALLMMLFFLTAAMHIISGFVNSSPGELIVSRAGTYFILIALIASMSAILKNDARLIVAALLGYCASYVLTFVLGTSPFDAYYNVPWRLGLGYSASLALAIFFVFFRRFLPLSGVAFFALGLLHLYFSSRNLALTSFVVAAFCVWSAMQRRRRPRQTKFYSYLAFALGVLIAVPLVEWALISFASNGLLTSELSAKILVQAAHSQGFWVAARPETFAAISAIQKYPWLGVGPGVVNAEVLEISAAYAAEALVGRTEEFESIKGAILQSGLSTGTQAHSHVIGAWVDAGLFAAVCWVVLFGFCITLLVKISGLLDGWAPTCLFISICTMWDIVFSPGPHRLDIALRIIVIFFALRRLEIDYSSVKLRLLNRQFVRSGNL